MVRGLEYYTGPVFEADLSLAATDDKGQPIRFGSVGGGGRYDGLVGAFPGRGRAGDRLFHRRVAALRGAQGDRVADCRQRAAQRPGGRAGDGPRSHRRITRRWSGGCATAGVRAELYLGAAGMKAQMKYADRRKSPCVVIQGSNERERGEVQIKDLIEGAQAAAAIASNEEWKAARPAQISVSEEIHGRRRAGNSGTPRACDA